jgi:DMSO reductase anchor subunit
MSHADDGTRPLVVFSSLAIAGAGTVAVAASGLYAVEAAHLAEWVGVLLLATGLVVSLSHLGQRHRAALAVRGLWGSPVSNEGAMGMVTVAMGLISASGVLGQAFEAMPRLGSGVLALGFLVTVGLVYRLPAQLTWNGASALTPITSGLAFGSIFVDALPPAHHVSTVTLVLVGVDAFVFAQRWRQVARVALEYPAADHPGFDRRHELLAGRFLLLNALPCITLFAWPTPLSAAIAGAGVMLDRVGFYTLALARRTETEVERVDRAIDNRPEA